jgi:hypothetical protein
LIIGIYLKNRPKAKWQLVSLTTSPESANLDLDEARKQAAAEGFEEAEVAIQSFDSTFYIPHFLNEIKVNKPLYN